MGAELLLYDPESDRLHILNETAMQVWQLCDGQHDGQDIVEEVARRYPEMDPGVVRRDTLRVIEELLLKGLLTT